jgi:hypothetical protein
MTPGEIFMMVWLAATGALVVYFSRKERKGHPWCWFLDGRPCPRTNACQGECKQRKEGK